MTVVLSLIMPKTFTAVAVLMPPQSNSGNTFQSDSVNPLIPLSGLFGNFGQTNYGAAKAGIAGFTRSLALEVTKYKCTVNTLSPGAATRLTLDLINAAGREYDENDWTQGPEQIAPVVTWLCSEDAQEVTSQIIHSQGGILGIMQQPAVIKSFTTDNLWTLELLDKLMPELIEAKKAHDKEVMESASPKKV